MDVTIRINNECTHKIRVDDEFRKKYPKFSEIAYWDDVPDEYSGVYSKSGSGNPTYFMTTHNPDVVGHLLNGLGTGSVYTNDATKYVCEQKRIGLNEIEIVPFGFMMRIQGGEYTVTREFAERYPKFVWWMYYEHVACDDCKVLFLALSTERPLFLYKDEYRRICELMRSVDVSHVPGVEWTELCVDAHVVYFGLRSRNSVSRVVTKSVNVPIDYVRDFAFRLNCIVRTQFTRPSVIGCYVQYLSETLEVALPQQTTPLVSGETPLVSGKTPLVSIASTLPRLVTIKCSDGDRKFILTSTIANLFPVFAAKFANGVLSIPDICMHDAELIITHIYGIGHSMPRELCVVMRREGVRIGNDHRFHFRNKSMVIVSSIFMELYPKANDGFLGSSTADPAKACHEVWEAIGGGVASMKQCVYTETLVHDVPLKAYFVYGDEVHEETITLEQIKRTKGLAKCTPWRLYGLGYPSAMVRRIVAAALKGVSPYIIPGENQSEFDGLCREIGIVQQPPLMPQWEANLLFANSLLEDPNFDYDTVLALQRKIANDPNTPRDAARALQLTL